MLQINHLTITHLKDLTQLISDLNVIVNSGDKLAIIGEEGTGKSTLLKAILSPQLMANYCILEGKIDNHFPKIGYLPQALSQKQEKMTVSKFLYDNLDYVSFDFNAFYQMAARLDLDIQSLENRNQILKSLSGGEKLKLQLAKLVGETNDLLLLDEPSSDLDAQAINTLQAFIQSSDKTIIFISHDEDLLEKTATAILHLELIKRRQVARASYFSGSYTDYMTYRHKAYSRQLGQAKNDRSIKAKRDAKIQRLHQAAEYNVRNTHDSTMGRLAAKKMKNVLSLEKRYAKEEEKMVDFPEEMDSIKLFFDDIVPLDKKKKLLSWGNHDLSTGQKVSLTILGQDKLVITGRNGIGKTRLLTQIYQELDKNHFSIGYMPQDYDSVFSKEMTALTFLTQVSDSEKARTLLASLQFTRQEIEHSVLELSGGQKAKLFLARMVLAQNHILILDEPTRHFSPTTQPLIRELLRNFNGCIISVSHDRKFIDDIANLRYQLTDKELQKY
ncbi:ATP-binding cassette domain-containing protein [Streptococcus gallolyticus subsp. gallolyticus]|uniref:ATP-binding cassette domain-containing protein n=1 Tax=Streptococcus gallolyticus TaxID=315405 RepID=UPI0020013097|nr:ATP-binding cassette domain-containing protein [Streptococcus gallolyticus]MCY7154846.1 ATP-binding cassette domain-containing protein [Streptococcus gallolyticus subsp. gallolyticus]MCY7173729.1 ATP-binding cassette domain-containing protein [Streptococcus gallolyticus subsp. gallolyticus]MCY7175850.1 ATP-binding cassette domain-containing protein [Streptococcus gallolyticus subsp. gallolyticus]MCY7180304.1 ATP-binding cassette domain-containing protein [Streptococcus gallolyticus subsp. ga